VKLRLNNKASGACKTLEEHTGELEPQLSCEVIAAGGYNIDKASGVWGCGQKKFCGFGFWEFYIVVGCILSIFRLL